MKKKLFVDGRVFDSQFQGTRTFIQNLYQIIDKIGDFEIFIGSENPENTKIFFPDAKNINFLKYKQNTSKFSRALVEIPFLINKHNIDAAHFQYVISPLSNKTLKIVTIHDILFKDFPEDFDLKYKIVKGTTFYFSAKLADIVTTVSKYSQSRISKHFNIPESDILITANGVANSYLEPFSKANSKKIIFEKYQILDYILFVSRIEPRKNQVGLLKSYLQLKLYDKNKHLVFIGNNDIPVHEITEIVSNLPENINNKIHFLSNINDAELRQFYQAADLFVYPSKSEGFGIPPLEAAASEVPVICSNTTAMQDFSFFGKFHIKPDNDNLIATIDEFYKNGIDKIELLANKKYIENNFSWKTSGEILNKAVLEKLKG